MNWGDSVIRVAVRCIDTFSQPLPNGRSGYDPTRSTTSADSAKAIEPFDYAAGMPRWLVSPALRQQPDVCPVRIKD